MGAGLKPGTGRKGLSGECKYPMPAAGHVAYTYRHSYDSKTLQSVTVNPDRQPDWLKKHLGDYRGMPLDVSVKSISREN